MSPHWPGLWDRIVERRDAACLLSGATSHTQVLNGGIDIVSSGGLGIYGVVSNGGTAVVLAGGEAAKLSLLSGGKLIDDGLVTISAAETFAGSLSGSGSLTETGGGDLILSGNGAAFSGHAVIRGGTIELSGASALGTGSVAFSGLPRTPCRSTQATRRRPADVHQRHLELQRDQRLHRPAQHRLRLGRQRHAQRLATGAE